MQTKSQIPPAYSKNGFIKDQYSLPEYRNISKTSDHIQIKIKMPNPSHEPAMSSKAPNQDLKIINVLFTFKIKMESQNS